MSLCDRENVTIVPFSFGPHEAVNQTLGGPGSERRQHLEQFVNIVVAVGGTGIYDAVFLAFQQAHVDEHTPSIVLMADGALTAGRTYSQFLSEWRTLPDNVRDMEKLATMTGGETFDEVFREVRAYQ